MMPLVSNNIFDKFKLGIGIPVLIVTLLAMMILPLPPFILDLLFSFNIALSLVVLLTCVYANRPLEFGVFPTVLLVSTLLRLALNIASTRVVLLNGHMGTSAAGKVVESFGSVVIGGNYAVGLVVFAILVIINFVVITKGAGRISEVSARFTLDAMPGKQMAIDADLNAGLISAEEAKGRRAEVRDEADFYGSMDGASKFVRGDAIAGLLILFINLIGGVLIGTFQHSMTVGHAVQNYALLTIGDGLVAQIPSLLLSIAAAIMVTRVSSSQDVSAQVLIQIFDKPKSLFVTASILGTLGLIPHMPHFAFLSLAAGVGAAGYFISKRRDEKALRSLQEVQHKEIEKTQNQELISKSKSELSWDDVVPVDTLGLEVGYRLIPLVDKQQGGKLMERIKGIRRKLSQELGFLIPPVHIRDNLELTPSHYRITLMGVTISESEIHIDKLLAINPGQVFGDIEGINAKDPAFGLKAKWIASAQKDYAQSLGYTVVDPSTVIATHISHVMKANAADLFGHEEGQHLLEKLRVSSPKLADEVTSDNLPLGTIVQVMQNLLREQIPITDVRTIAETLAQTSPRSRDSDVLTAAVRVALNRLIIQSINGLSNELPVITLMPELERILLTAIQVGGEDGSGLEPGLVEKLQRSIMEIAQRQEVAGFPAVLLVAPQLRNLLARFVRMSSMNIHVLSYQEVPENKQLKVVGSVGQ